jgi:hypothetical protein
MKETVKLTLNDILFKKAMAEYVAATGKDSAEAINRQARNFAIKCISSTKPSKGAAAIKSIEKEDWWPKIIAGIMLKRSGKKENASEAYQAQWAARKRKERLAAGAHKKAFMLDKREKIYADLAQKISKAVLSQRVKAISFLRFFFRTLAQKMSAHAKGAAVPGGKEFPGFTSTVRPASANQLSVKMENTYKYKYRGSESASGAEALIQKAMSVALPATIADMKRYTAEKLAKRAKQYSGSK